jgi:cytosine/adenosine deaminase-related metal-dependent hydrolase
MVVRILIVDSTIVLRDRVVPRGFVFIEEGWVKAIGEGEPDESYQLADTLIGGGERIVLPPAVALFTLPEVYGLRYLPLNPYKVLRNDKFRRKLLEDDEVAYYMSLIAFYELAVQGYASTVAVSVNPVQAARALSNSGLWGFIVLPLCGINFKDATALLQEAKKRGDPSRVKLGIAYCTSGERYLAKRAADDVGAELVVEVGFERAYLSLGELSVSVDYSMISARPSPATFSLLPFWVSLNPHLNPKAHEALDHLLYSSYQLLKGKYPLTKGSPADVLVVDVSEPPSMVFTYSSLIAQLASAPPRVETLISHGSIVVDGGQHLFVGGEACRRAREVISGALEQLEAVLREG